MNKKKLADMVKTIRKEKMEMMDMNTSSNVKGPSRDVAEEILKEYQARSAKTHTLVGTKTPSGRRGYHKKVSMPKGGSKTKDRYKLSSQLAEKKEASSNSKTTIINTTPEQDSSMVGTQ
jgi:hypothetical protein